MTVRPVASERRRIRPSFSSTSWPPPALDDAGAQLAQHVGEREDLLLVGPQRRDVHALRIEVALVARHRKAERAGLHALAHEVLHLP